ncbi:MAG: Ig-like domain-containing protein, partial [Synergistaceae bacterium]|nr:Ig-like domain-containing protein [Synergistaceae bacterium]
DNGTVSNCAVSCDTISGGRVGGVVGMNQHSGSTVSNCAVNCATITGGDRGGVVGYLSYGTVSNCGWLDIAGLIGIGSVYSSNPGTSSDVVSYDSTTAGKIVVACLPDTTSLTVNVGDTGTVTLKTYPSNTASFDKHLSGDVTLNVNPATIAETPERSGKVITVTGKAIGSGVLTTDFTFKSTYFNGAFDQTSGDKALSLATALTVKSAAVAVTGITLIPTSAAIDAGRTLRLVATIAPANATNKNVVWSSSAPGIVSVDQTGIITGVAAGNAVITVKTEDGGFIETCGVIVNTAPDVEEVSPDKYTDKAMAAAASGISADNLDVNASGDVVVKEEFAQGALDSLNLDGVALGKVMPVVKGGLTAAGNIAGLKFEVKGSEFGITNVSEAKVMKILANGTGQLFTIITTEAAIANKTAAIYDPATRKMVTTIDPAKDYVLVAFVKDAPDGFDLDNATNKQVIDPGVILKPDGTPKKSSSGGCSSGFGMLALLALVPMVMRKKK